MDPVELNRKLVLQERSQLADGAGGQGVAWSVLGTLWANVRARSARDIARDEVAGAFGRYRIVVRAAPVGALSRPRAGQRLVEGARVFEVRAVTDHDASGHYLALLADEEVAS